MNAHSLGRIATGVAVACVLGGAAMYVVSSGLVDLNHRSEPRNVADIGGQTVPLPRPAEHPVRLAPAVSTASRGEFSSLPEGAAGPILHDPCIAIRWQLSTANMPIGAQESVMAAVDSIGVNTGLVWVFDAYTGSAATFESPLLVRRDTWEYSPVVIGWAAAGDVVDLEGDTAGVGGPRIASGAFGDQEFLRSGTVVVSTADLPDVLEDERDKGHLQAVVMHELGHVVGLGHVADGSQLMFPAATAIAEWGPGDLEGLAAVGNGPCEGA